MNLHAILIRAPINKLAASVVSQRQAAPESSLSREELAYLVQRLERRHRLLKVVLGIKTKAQHANAMSRFNKGVRQFREAREPRAFAEYRLVGQQMLRLIQELAEMRRARRLIAATEAPADVPNHTRPP